MIGSKGEFVPRAVPGPNVPEGAADVRGLEVELRRAVRGEVQFDAGARALYATDASNFRHVPIGVVRPLDAEDVQAAIAACRAHGAPVLPRGAGTSLAGQCCNVAVVLDFSKHMNRILEIDPARRIARVQPGVILDHLRDTAKTHGLTFGPDPSTHTHCTIGGMLGNNACGVHAQMAGRMSDNVHALDVVTWRGARLRVGRYDDAALDDRIGRGGVEGELLSALRDLRDAWADEIRARFAPIPRRVSGYNLDELLPERGFHVARALVGSEGTCATIVEATLRLVPEPGARVLLVLGFADVFDAADHVPAVLGSGPIGVEGIDEELVRDLRARRLHVDQLDRLPDGDGFLVLEYGADTVDRAREVAEAVRDRLERAGALTGAALYVDPAEQKAIWKVREAGLAATARVPGRRDAWPGWEDSAVAPERLGDYLRELKALFDQYGYTASTYGHFGQGCVHCRIDFDLQSVDGIHRYRRFLEDAARLCVRHGGSLSGEHGDGQQRAELLSIQFGDELVGAMRRFKAIWDPDGAMNPGKIVDPRPLDADLRLGADYAPVEPETWFRYPNDDGRFARAALRCVGVGSCRREEGGTMCPSYKATREEMHSTRGRAHLLWEMMQPGSPVAGERGADAVHEALDLCLACKGCKGDCPMSVDVATYKAEFYARYYQTRARPREAWLLGYVREWARLASVAPRLANLATRAPVLGRVARWAARVHPDRALPAFADETFRAWFRRRERPNRGGERVVLWVDTWTDHFRPEVGRAAVEVLEGVGLDVHVLPQALCCGRPLYEFGMLDRAERLLEQCLDATRPWVRAGVPIVALEPSCASVFRDELVERFPDREEARALAEGVRGFAEILAEHGARLDGALAGRKVLVHGHCHQKALWGTDAERAALSAMGADVEVLDTGCCGMAGSFGYARDKYDVSVAVGELDLLPKVRGAAPDAIVVADGFSCRSQIEDLTDRRGLHLAEVARLALGSPEPEARARRGLNLGAMLVLAGAAVLGWALLDRARRR